MAEIPDELRREGIETARLPRNWRESEAPPDLAHFGDEFVQRREHCLLLVPSVLAPSENNCLINPAHPEYKKIIVRELENLNYDPRMFRKQLSRRRH